MFDYFQRRLPYLCEKHKVKEISEAQKILDDLVTYYNDQRIHEETREIPTQRWEDAVNHGKGQLRPLEPSIDLDRIFAIHLQRKVRKDGTIMFMPACRQTGERNGLWDVLREYHSPSALSQI